MYSGTTVSSTRYSTIYYSWFGFGTYINVIVTIPTNVIPLFYYQYLVSQFSGIPFCQYSSAQSSTGNANIKMLALKEGFLFFFTVRSSCTGGDTIRGDTTTTTTTTTTTEVVSEIDHE